MKNNIRSMNKGIKRLLPLAFATSVCCLIVAGRLDAQIAFSTNFAQGAGGDPASSLDSNFVALAPFGTSSLAWSGNSTSGTVTKSGAGAQSILFDQSATGGTAGSGGGSGSQQNNNYSNVTTKVNFDVGAYNNPSLGLWTHVNNAGTSGYLALINPISATSVRLRIFDTDSNPTTTTVGTVLIDQTLTPTANINLSTFYQASLTTAVSGGNVVLTLSLFDATGTTLLASTTATDTTSAVLSGQVGIRLGSAAEAINSFDVSPVPEPTTWALLGAGSLCLLAFRHRSLQA